jgi:hypothetical protein
VIEEVGPTTASRAAPGLVSQGWILDGEVEPKLAGKELPSAAALVGQRPPSFHGNLPSLSVEPLSLCESVM